MRHLLRAMLIGVCLLGLALGCQKPPAPDPTPTNGQQSPPPVKGVGGKDKRPGLPPPPPPPPPPP